MLGYRHRGFSLDTRVCIAAHDRAGLERLRKAGRDPVYRCVKQHSEPGARQQGGDKGGGERRVQVDEQHLSRWS